MDASRRGKWREAKHRDRIRQQFTLHPELFDMLIRCGYEKDRDWFASFSAEAGQVPLIMEGRK